MNMLALMAVAVLAQTQAGPAKLDMTSSLPQMAALTDGKDHYIVYVKREHPVPEVVFYGDGKSFYRLDKSGGFASGTESWSVVWNEPRDPVNRPSLAMRESGKVYEVTCKTKRAFTAVTPEMTEKMLAAASFFEPRWQRQMVALLRDEKGTYFFVDQQRGPERRDVRVLVGPKGKMVLQPLKEVADDSEGLVLKTKNGDLRLVINTKQPQEGQPLPPTSKWIKGQTSTELIRLSLDSPRNVTVVMVDLGVYDGVVVGTPCDDTP